MRLIDAHTHMELLALRTVPFESIRSVEELVEFLKTNDVSIAWGWDEKRLGRAIEGKDLMGIERPSLSVLSGWTPM
ncbi:MAG: hypothetical protein Q9N34_03755 [Aquificota bacterium]|nr:hypothetical protein [Aquificota bacterium]